MGRKQNFTNQHFWARGFLVSTVGKDEAVIRDYIKNQEKMNKEPKLLNDIYKGLTTMNPKTIVSGLS
jgi:hypothetical protein